MFGCQSHSLLRGRQQPETAQQPFAQLCAWPANLWDDGKNNNNSPGALSLLAAVGGPGVRLRRHGCACGSAAQLQGCGRQHLTVPGTSHNQHDPLSAGPSCHLPLASEPQPGARPVQPLSLSLPPRTLLSTRLCSLCDTAPPSHSLRLRPLKPPPQNNPPKTTRPAGPGSQRAGKGGWVQQQPGAVCGGGRPGTCPA